MAAQERGAVKGSNDQMKAPIGSSGPQPREASPVRPPNEARGGDWRAGSYPLAGEASPVRPPNNMGGDRRGYSDDRMPPTATEPGKGAVPVNPGLAGRGPMAPAEMKRGR